MLTHSSSEPCTERVNSQQSHLRSHQTLSLRFARREREREREREERRERERERWVGEVGGGVVVVRQLCHN